MGAWHCVGHKRGPGTQKKRIDASFGHCTCDFSWKKEAPIIFAMLRFSISFRDVSFWRVPKKGSNAEALRRCLCATTAAIEARDWLRPPLFVFVRFGLLQLLLARFGTYSKLNRKHLEFSHSVEFRSVQLSSSVSLFEIFQMAGSAEAAVSFIGNI